jgi:hypothetical protein
MARTPSLIATQHDWRFVALIGLAGFPAALALFHFILSMETGASAFHAAIAAVAAMTIARAFLAQVAV